MSQIRCLVDSADEETAGILELFVTGVGFKEEKQVYTLHYSRKVLPATEGIDRTYPYQPL